LWNRPDALEHLKRLLVDPDAQVRELALKVVEENRMLSGSEKDSAKMSALARRVKAVAADPALKARVLALFAANGIDPGVTVADLELGRSHLLSFSTFRKKVNPLFYQAGDDQQACANCHGNHTILRIAEAVGGARWESTETPAYRAILDWIREASRFSAGLHQAGTYSADSYSPGYEPALAGDRDLSTIWHTEFVGASPGYPHELVVDLGNVRELEGLLYVPRQNSSNGRVRDFEIRTSTDGRSFGSPVASGSWPNDPTFKYVPLSGSPARYVQLRGLNEVEGRPIMSAAEVSVESRSTGGGAR
jgi:hypothetical protein